MKFQKMELISAGTDFDILRLVFELFVVDHCLISYSQESYHGWLLSPSSKSERHRRIC